MKGCKQKKFVYIHSDRAPPEKALITCNTAQLSILGKANTYNLSAGLLSARAHSRRIANSVTAYANTCLLSSEAY